ncbi:ABC transporter ATP-binding protein [Streptomyces jumonjinensis]|uniref:ABC transporter ATP-binding protein n=1 Tax=Streptomyces jumonjinensis TaxID=1945 RepID=A0A646KNY9_STRJU|nr:ABC transporter ATP-binding protein [Streptomyces jumonjinensis]MQT02696.1 ABC transporter ATP-binding protein [Streptomyces jumonjinensis]
MSGARESREERTGQENRKGRAGDTARGRTGGARALLSRTAEALALSLRAGPVGCLCSALLATVQGLLPAGIALLTKWLLDRLQHGPAAGGPQPLALVAGLALLTTLYALLPQLSEYAQARLRRGIVLVVQDRLYGAVNRFTGMARFESPAFLDRLRLAQEAAVTAPERITASLFAVVQQSLTVAGLITVLFTISPPMTLITVAAAAPVLLVETALSRERARMTLSLSPRNRRQLFYQRMLLDLAAVKEIRLFGLGGFLLRRMNDETRVINAAEERLDRRALLRQAPLTALGTVIAAGGLAWMIMAAADGRFTIGDVSAFIASVSGVQGALVGMLLQGAGAYQALLLLGHFTDVTTAGPDLPVRREPLPTGPLSRGVELDDVWFRYGDDGPWVLRGVSLTIPYGSSLALVGLNGAGKSTLVKLLCRLYDPVRGAIRWDGTDLRDMDPGRLRDRISAVFQDYVEYDFTAADNIGLGDLAHHGELDRIVAAARAADAHDLVSALPRGYATLLSRVFTEGSGEGEAGEAGVSLSGGQWQRLALARAMMREGRDLLILDEPSAGLDAAAEERVHRRLRAYRAGATSLLISHRLGAVRRADRIAVLEEGRITEAGSHRELMRRAGTYARLFTIQASGYADAHGPDGTGEAEEAEERC